MLCKEFFFQTKFIKSHILSVLSRRISVRVECLFVFLEINVGVFLSDYLRNLIEGVDSTVFQLDSWVLHVGC